MRRYTSLVMLTAGRCLGRVLLLLAAMGAAQIALFLPWLERRQDVYDRAAETGVMAPYDLNTIFQKSHVSTLWAVGLLALLMLLLYTASRGGEYTLRRLRMSGMKADLTIALSNLLLLVLFWAGELVVLLGLAVWYNAQLPAEYAGPNTVFLACYQADLLHSILPMGEILRWVRNGFVLICLALSTAQGASCLRRGKRPMGVFILSAVAALTWVSQAWQGGLDLIVMMAAGFVAVYALVDLESYHSGREDRDHERNQNSLGRV